MPLCNKYLFHLFHKLKTKRHKNTGSDIIIVGYFYTSESNINMYFELKGSKAICELKYTVD